MTHLTDFFSNIDFYTMSIPAIRASDILDIAIVAVIIYTLMIWIKETRAWSLFKGIIIIFVISTLAFQLNLYTIRWIISNTLSVGIIAIIILFQPEFRKGLEQLGKSNFMTKVFTKDDDLQTSNRTFEEILTAVQRMAAIRMGALILIEKEVPLGDLEQTGIKIDAAVSSQLLINIFEDKTPLHDGAVIIRNGRIAAATCILPLTQKDIGTGLGTRHRAAVGGSEVSDADIIVVSEETGSISIANGGILYKDLTLNEARDMLIVAPGNKPIKPKRGKGGFKYVKKNKSR